MKLEPGTVIDRYRVEAEIGRGGMARVYRVRHTTLDTLHALKVLTVTGEELRERLVREGKVQARLDHDNVLPVRDILDLEHGPGLLMDFIDGPSLDAWLRDHDPDDAERERIFAAIVAGVGFAHAQGVVHRDLKPGNVMMQLRHGEWVPRVADFGLAKLVAADEGQGQLQSRTGRPMGTPAYMAPEQVRSAKHVDARADVFALGCILYELFCGQRAFVGGDSLDVFNRITQGNYRRPREAGADLEPRLEQAISGALAVHADDRIPDCETLLAVLRGDRSWVMASSPSETFFGDEPSAEVAIPVAAGTAAQTAVPESYDAMTPAPLDGSLAPESAASLVPPSPAPPLPAPSAGRPALWALGGVAATLLLLALAAVGLGDRSPPAPPAAVQPTSAEPAPAPDPVAPVAPAPVAVPLAAPSPTPVLDEPAPAPAPATPVAPSKVAPSGPPSGAGRVEITGDAQSVRFRSSGGDKAEAGDLPPGSYVIEAVFDGGPAMHAGNLELRAGQTVRLRCSSDTLMCSP